MSSSVAQLRQEDQLWSVFDPQDVPELQDRYGDDFDTAYVDLENNDKAISTLPARRLWDRILQAQIETGMPFMLFHDAINRTFNPIDETPSS